MTIGIFDSGMGGLTVCRALRDVMASTNIVYLGDTARLPYGTKSPETVIRYAQQASRVLMERNISLLVVACNTASSVALPALRAFCVGIPVLGVVEPGAQSAVAHVRQCGHGAKIGVLGTEATIQGGAYHRAISHLDPTIEVYGQAAQVLVALAEEGWSDNEVAVEAISRYMTPLVEKGISSVVLGCTHFPVFTSLLQESFPQIAVIDSASTTAQAVKELGEDAGDGTTHFIVTDSVERFTRVGALFWGETPQNVELVDL